MIRSPIKSPIRSVFSDGTVWLDRFDDTDGTIISAHDSEIGGAYTGTATIVGNALVNQGGDSEYAMWDDGVSKKEYSFISVSLLNQYQTHIRIADTYNKFQFLRFNYGTFQLYEANLGVVTLRASPTVPYIAGEVITVRDEGDRIIIYHNGVEKINYQTTLHNSATANRIQTHASSGDTLDTLEVRAL